MLDLGVELGAEQDDDCRDPHPHHHADGRAKRAIGRVVCAEIGDVPGEQRRADQPSERRGGAPYRKPSPARLPAARPAAIDRGESDRRKEQKQRPPQNDDREFQEGRQPDDGKDDGRDDYGGKGDHEREDRGGTGTEARQGSASRSFAFPSLSIDDVERVDDRLHSGVLALQNARASPAMKFRG